MTKHHIERTKRSKVFLIETHDLALSVWKTLGIHQHLIIHFDRHLDLGPKACSDCRCSSNSKRPWTDLFPWNSGNFLAKAVEDGIINEIVWINPWILDEPYTHESFLLRSIIETKELARLSDLKLDRSVNDRIKFNIAGIPCTFLTNYRALKDYSDHKFLLDIDTDAFVGPRGRLGEYPTESLEKMAHKSSCITIAASIKDGYVPSGLSFVTDMIYRHMRGEVGQFKRLSHRFHKKKTNGHATVPKLSTSKINDYSVAYALNNDLSLPDKFRHSTICKVSPYSRFLLACLLMEEEKFPAVRGILERLIREGYRDSSIFYLLSQCLMKLGDYKEAERSVLKAIAKNSSHADYHGLSGLLLLRRGEVKKAYSFINSATVLRPTSWKWCLLKWYLEIDEDLEVKPPVSIQKRIDLLLYAYYGIEAKEGVQVPTWRDALMWIKEMIRT